ncbi:MAG TPA: nitrate ABC transporter substrate-binding protein [Chloroflexi bacterium]|jgi:NitT/TauT family transport system substrate-binding protein|nr:nitrate ABC transporter substrate-binding protein [Chloroflexota bacterium]HAL26264.1 nitrate ABC transporter substrate-binding protein [Chloroflexota bacterium]
MRSRFPALVLITSLIAAACGGSAGTPGPATTTAAGTVAAATKPAPAKISIMVGGLNKQIYLPNKLTEALGYFADQNLTVDLIDEPSGKDTTVEVVAGNVDFGSGSYDHTIDIAAAGKSITMVTLLLQEPGEFVMVAKQKADTIKSPKDWKGANAGVTALGSGTHTLMRVMAIKAGLALSDVNYVAAGAGDTFIAAMKQGKIDVGITTQPTVLRMQKTGDGLLLVDLSKPETTRAALGGDYPFISVFARADYIAKNKDIVQRVVNAYVKTLKWIGTHTPLEIAEKLPTDYYGGDKDGYVQALKDSMGMFSPDGKMTKGAPEFELSLLKQFNENVQKNPNIDLSTTYTDEYVNAAK